MAYLLDSDQCIYALARQPETIALINVLLSDGCAISVITYMEVYQGIIRSSNPERAQVQLREFLRGISVIPVTTAVAECCAAIRQQLRDQVKRVNTRALDLLNAATAITHDLTLVTRNIDDNNDIARLSLYEFN